MRPLPALRRAPRFLIPAARRDDVLDSTSADAPRKAKISPDVLFRELVGEAVLLDLKTQRYYGLDEVGTRIWQLLQEQGRTDAVLAALCAEYDVDEARLRRDLSVFIGELADAGLIVLSAPTAE